MQARLALRHLIDVSYFVAIAAEGTKKTKHAHSFDVIDRLIGCETVAAVCKNNGNGEKK